MRAFYGELFWTGRHKIWGVDDVGRVFMGVIILIYLAIYLLSAAPCGNRVAISLTCVFVHRQTTVTVRF